MEKQINGVNIDVTYLGFLILTALYKDGQINPEAYSKIQKMKIDYLNDKKEKKE